MNYSTNFGLFLDVRFRCHADDLVLARLKLPIAKASISEQSIKSRGVLTPEESYIRYLVGENQCGHPENEIESICDKISREVDLAARTNQPDSSWLILQLYDVNFVQINLSHRLLAKLSTTGLSLAIENRTSA